ncbi:MAG TPA: hypothetical protein VNL98_01200 [Gemmatimonadales bacterium]|nr:hypothetical protein [Gemmatimonadales bacterium]
MKRLFPVAALAASAILVACEEDAPTAVNPAQMSTELSSVIATFENNAAFQSLSQLSSRFPNYAAVALLRSRLPDIPSRPEDVAALRSYAAEMAARFSRPEGILASPGDVQALFPADVLGKTLVWDVNTDQYVVGNLSGAPANGIRILIYTIDPASGQPFEPLQQLGYVNLTDESTAQADRLGVELKLGTTTIADYTVSATVTTTSIQLGAVGFVRSADGTRQVNFNLTTTVSANGVAVNYQVTGNNGVSVSVTGNLTQTGSQVTFTVSRGGASIELAVNMGATITGTVKFNGVTVATISGDPGNPTFTGAGGRALTQEEVQSLLAIFEAAGSFLEELSDGVFGPAAVVF